MRKNILWSLLTALVAVSAARAQSTSTTESSATKFYIEPSLVVAFPGKFDTAVGGGFATGANFARHHCVEAEVIYFSSSQYYYYKIDFMPILVSYKYEIPLNPTLSVYAGGSVG